MHDQFEDTLESAKPDLTTASRQSTIIEEKSDVEDGAIRFGRFRAVPRSRQLMLDDQPREIGGRAFDLLMVLLRSNGAIVSKDDILNEVWPSMVVEECNLRFQIRSLRRALGDRGDLIKTVIRRGYMLVRETPKGRELSVQVETESLATYPETTNTSAKKTAPYIVLIEDDENVRVAISALLGSTGRPVDAYESVNAYQSAGSTEPPDCLILDICLPGRSGLDFQADLVRTGLRYPIVFISGHADIQMSVRAMKAGAVEFLTKPVRHQDLLSAVDMAINA